MEIVKFQKGDILELKKNHPCGSKRFEVLRGGSEVRLRCLGCGHDMTIARLKVEKAIRKVYPGESDGSGGRDGREQ